VLQIKERYLDNHLVYYPSPLIITYFWSFGFLAGLCLVIQIVSGIFMAMYYVPNVDYAFLSLEHVMRNVPNGWLLRYLHANGASFFFFVVYCHIFRNIYYGSYVQPRRMLWLSGMVIYILMMATAFLGYVLPWGQMSFWGATVITNLFSVVPFVGTDLVQWLWSGFCVNNATLNKFFCIHFVLPFLIIAMVILHLIFLHRHGSSNPLGVSSESEYVNFYPYFYVKDLFAFFVMLNFLSFFVFFEPNSLGHPINYIMSNPLVTPPHIVPEWYFLTFYAVLRAIPSKMGGVLTMFGSIVAILELTFFVKSVRNGSMDSLYRLIFWSFFFVFIFLALLGQKVIEVPYIYLAEVFSIVYFLLLYFIAFYLTSSHEK
jgi:ubiquinol-cytochrome c reductase cytochrome b subunit